jgi:hypothetical protein
MSSCANGQVPLKTGRNVWLLARTDRDGVGAEDVVVTGAAFLMRVLGAASPISTRGLFEVAPSPRDTELKGALAVGRYVIAGGRPVEIRSWRARPSLGGEKLGNVQDCVPPKFVKAVEPWFVTVDFDWRPPNVDIKWPRRKVNAFGLVDTDADFDNDWLLLEARFQGVSTAPDTSIFSEIYNDGVKPAAQAAAKAVGSAVTQLAVVGVGLIVLNMLINRSK